MSSILDKKTMLEYDVVKDYIDECYGNIKPDDKKSEMKLNIVLMISKIGDSDLIPDEKPDQKSDKFEVYEFYELEEILEKFNLKYDYLSLSEYIVQTDEDLDYNVYKFYVVLNRNNIKNNSKIHRF
jgi:hypothetical protein